MDTDLIDVLDTNGFFTGKRSTRFEIHKDGLFHRAVHVYLINAAGEILLQQRSHFVDHYPNTLSISVTGHIHAGEGGSAAAKREIHEELGISPDKYTLEFLFSAKQEATLSPSYIDRQFNDVFLCTCNSTLPEMTLDSKEVSSAAFFTMEAFVKMVAEGDSRIAPVYRKEVMTLLNCTSTDQRHPLGL
jgi:isopentenyl-diphosphate delta-isomerase